MGDEASEVADGGADGGTAVGSPAWLELERARLRGTDRVGKEARGTPLTVIGVVVLVGFGLFDVWIARPHRGSLFELTPYGVLLLCVFPILLGVGLIIGGWRTRS